MKRYVISFLIGIILLGFGCCYLIFEVMAFNQAELPEKFRETSSANYEYILKENEIYNIVNYVDGKINVVIDNALENQMSIKATFSAFYNDISIYKNLSEKNLNGNNIYRLYFSVQSKDDLVSMKQMYEIVKEMVKNKEYYDDLETLTAPWLEIRLNESDLNQLQINEKTPELFIKNSEQNKITES